jgi:uncharacterized repeat protein (TIGR03803 family)
MPRQCSFLPARAFTIFSLTLVLAIHSFAASKARVLHTFQAGKDGARPWATLLLDDKTGTLYGTAEEGGNHNQACENYFQTGCGTIFSLSPSGKGWKETVLYRFQGGSDGGHPRGPLVPRPDGYFYSTTTTGGGGNQGGIGTAFRIKPGTWKEEVIFRFPSYPKGAYPQGAIAFDRKGNLYGLTVNGGPLGASGVAFELIPRPVGEWKEVVLYDNVGLPYAGMVLDHDGNLYGTTDENGTFNEGSVFELSHGKLGWQFTNLYSFQDPAGVGVQPSDLTADKQGNLFGFAADAGIVCYPHPYSCGTVFEMTRVHGTWQEKTLYEFKDVADGWGPGYGAPVFDRAGNLYGTTGGGGKYGFGTVFKLSPVKGGWQKTTLYSFPGGAGGVEPIGGLVLDGQGNIFGTTYFGGGGTGKCKQQGCGILFEITP